jgi:hypothetical protein
MAVADKFSELAIDDGLAHATVSYDFGWEI